jgi:hypothetical protein
VATWRLKNLDQGERQSVRELVTHIEELEQDIPALSTEELRAWTLLNCLRGDIRREVLRENRTISSREQVIASAQRQEELLGDKRRARVRTVGVSQASHEHVTRKRSDKRSDLCYKCQKPGHIAKNCLNKADAGTSQG